MPVEVIGRGFFGKGTGIFSVLCFRKDGNYGSSTSIVDFFGIKAELLSLIAS